jgi:hypothetical protein
MPRSHRQGPDADAVEPEEERAAPGGETTADEASGMLDAVSGWFVSLFARPE